MRLVRACIIIKSSISSSEAKVFSGGMYYMLSSTSLGPSLMSRCWISRKRWSEVLPSEVQLSPDISLCTGSLFWGQRLCCVSREWTSTWAIVWLVVTSELRDSLECSSEWARILRISLGVSGWMALTWCEVSKRQGFWSWRASIHCLRTSFDSATSRMSLHKKEVHELTESLHCI